MPKWLSQKLGSTPTPGGVNLLQGQVRWDGHVNLLLRWYLRTFAGLIRGLPASQIPYEKLLNTVHGMDCFLRMIIAQHQNCLTRHGFVLDATMKFYRKCSRKRRKLGAVHVRSFMCDVLKTHGDKGPGLLLGGTSCSLESLQCHPTVICHRSSGALTTNHQC